MRRRGMWLLLATAVLAIGADECRPKDTVPPSQTAITQLEVAPTRIARGASVTLRWEAINVGRHDDRPSCSFTQRVEGEAADDPFEVSCSGTMTLVPPAPPTASYVRYQFSVLKRPLVEVDSYITRVVTVEFAQDAVVSIEPGGATLAFGASQDFTATVAGTSDGVAWSASCGSITGSGPTITYTAPLEAGSCTLTATSVADPTAQASVVVLVVSPIDTVTIDQRAVALTVGSSIMLTVTVEAEPGAPTSVDWSTSDAGVASVDASGSVTAVAPGTAVVTATSTLDASKSDSIVVTVTAPVDPGALLWSRVIGQASEERAGGVAVDRDGTVVVALSTDGELGAFSQADFDVVVVAYDALGVSLWVRQLGTDGADFATGVAVDDDGNVLVTGSTTGSFDGDPAGERDVLVAKLDRLGNLLWRRQFGTEFSDAATAIGVDGDGNVYVTGTTQGTLGEARFGSVDGFIAKLTPDGEDVWIRQFGSGIEDYPSSLDVSADGTTVVAGTRYRADGFVRRFDTLGNETWLLGKPTYDTVMGAAFDGDGNIVVVGSATENPFAFPAVAYLEKYDADGDVVWSRSLGPAEGSNALAVGTDSDGNVLVSGTTSGALDVDNPDGAAFLTKYDADGNRLWVKQFDPGARYLAVGPDGSTVVSATDDDDVRVWKFAR